MRHATPRRSLVAAALCLLPAPWAALDLANSVEEYRILQAWSVCSEPEQGCLAIEEATFEGPYHARRSALQQWYATDEDGQLASFDLQPGYAHLAETMPGPGLVYRVNGEIVAVAKADSTEYAPTAMSGSHAITFDSFVLLMLFGVFAMGLRTAIAARREGLAWSDKIPPQVVERRGIDRAVVVGGVAGLFTAVVLAPTGAVAWALPLLIAAAVAVYPVMTRLVRKRRGTGRHAA